LSHVGELARCFEAQIVFLYVIEPALHAIELHDFSSGVSVELTKQASDEAKTYLDSWKGEFREKGIEASVCVEHGPVVATIIEVADQESVDLIAMASHVRSGLSHVFYGSAAIGVLHRVDRSLRIIRSR
jgi:nucleotide-binding universal stress UspA family protein